MSASAQGLCEFIDASPSPFHVCETVAERLRAAGFTELCGRRRAGAPTRAANPAPPRAANPAPPRLVLHRARRLAGRLAGPASPVVRFRIVGAHTDSPNLRVKQHPDRFVSGWQVVALQPYGGAWLNSWLDRDLGISGRLSVRSGDAIEHRLIRIDEPILRVPQLAIHLAEDRKSVSLDPQRHVNAVWGVGSGARSFLGYVAEQAGVDADDVLGVDLMTHDLTPSTLAGADGELLSAPRLDNQCTCYAGLEAFLAAEPRDCLPVLALFDHEEVGSQSDHGAQSELLLDRAGAHRAGRGRRPRRLPAPAAGIDGGLGRHGARHPPELPGASRAGHLIEVNAGPVLKVQPNLRYATDGRTAAAFALACAQAGVPLAALRTPGRPAVRVDDRADDLGAHRHPDGGRRRGPAGHALGARGDGRRRRRRLLGGAAARSCRRADQASDRRRARPGRSG